MPTPEKEATVAELRELMQSIDSVLLADYRGLRVAEMAELRRRLREAGAKMMVVKNRLLRIAIDDTPKADLRDCLVGPTALAFDDDPAATAKVLADFARDFPALEVKAGFVEGRLVSPAEIQELARLPSRPQLLAQVVGAINAPIAGLVYTLQSIIGELVMTLQAIADQRSEAEGAT